MVEALVCYDASTFARMLVLAAPGVEETIRLDLDRYARFVASHFDYPGHQATPRCYVSPDMQMYIARATPLHPEWVAAFAAHELPDGYRPQLKHGGKG